LKSPTRWWVPIWGKDPKCPINSKGMDSTETGTLLKSPTRWWVPIWGKDPKCPINSKGMDSTETGTLLDSQTKLVGTHKGAEDPECPINTNYMMTSSHILTSQNLSDDKLLYNRVRTLDHLLINFITLKP
jgi:hypothetical protein